MEMIGKGDLGAGTEWQQLSTPGAYTNSGYLTSNIGGMNINYANTGTSNSYTLQSLNSSK
jgi:hypothetical protein